MSKMTSEVAMGFVKRIESLNAEIGGVYREAGEYGDDITNINLIRDIVTARENAADAKLIADGLLESIDLEASDGD